MPKDVYYGKTLRKSFARVEEVQDMPNLLEIQKNSYKWFLEEGLQNQLLTNLQNLSHNTESPSIV